MNYLIHRKNKLLISLSGDIFKVVCHKLFCHLFFPTPTNKFKFKDYLKRYTNVQRRIIFRLDNVSGKFNMTEMETIFVTPDDNEIITENYQNVSNFLLIPILNMNMKSYLHVIL